MLEVNRIYNNDCLELMKELPDKCIDLVLTDPPYFGIVKNDWDNQWRNMQEFQKWVNAIGIEIKRILKDNGSFYWFGDDKTIAYCQIVLDKHFRLLNNLVWRKQSYQTMKGAKSVFRSFAPITERCLFYDKSEDLSDLDVKNYFREERQKTDLSYKEINKNVFNTCSTGGGMAVNILNADVKGWSFPTQEKYEALQKIGICQKPYSELRQEYEEKRRAWNNDNKALDVLDYNIFSDNINKFHPTQKPVDLIKYMVERSSNVGQLVLDPFSGSGTTAIACHNLNRNFICIEKDYDYWKASVERLENAQAQQKLF